MAGTNEVDIGAFAMTMVLERAFAASFEARRAMLEDDGGSASGSPASKEADKQIASTMAQAITGFGA
jgi:hypothetical protein